MFYWRKNPGCSKAPENSHTLGLKLHSLERRPCGLVTSSCSASMVNVPGLPCNQEPTSLKPTIRAVKCGPPREDQRECVPMMHLYLETTTRCEETVRLSPFSLPSSSAVYGILDQRHTRPPPPSTPAKLFPGGPWATEGLLQKQKCRERHELP